MEYEINGEDLTLKAQVRLRALYHENVELSPLAIIETEQKNLV